MKKTLQYFMLITLIGTQVSGLVNGINLYASEISSYSEVSTDNVISNEDLEHSELLSEVLSEESAVSEASSEDLIASEESAVSEASSEDSIASEESSVGEASSEDSVASEEPAVSEANSALDLNQIDAKITIEQQPVSALSQKAAPTSFIADDNLEADENLSLYENDLRLEANSGESTIMIEPTTKSKSVSNQIADTPIYYVLTDDGELSTGSTKQPRSYNGNLLTVLNGKIIDSDSAIARTSGGYDTTFYIYQSIEDLKSNTNPVPLSGGGYDATFIETVEQDGVYYDHIAISGYDGYTLAGNIQIVPEQLIKSRSYYTVEDGNWAYYSAIDPVTSTDYDKMVIGEAPANAKAGVKYYSDDDQNYYTDPILTDATAVEPTVYYNTYFQNLPFRSESNYTAANFKSYLNSKGKNSSEYYNETTAFTKAQSLESVNSLLIFSMANHESAYGTSSYARACYNFFGRGAVDSDPDKACQQYGYNTATDGILAQTLFLQNGYFDVLDWRYSGTHVGNKASGMNVKYASDPDWGKKISNHAYMMDQYMGGKEENKYAILKVSGVSHVYTNGDLSTKVKSSGDSGKYSYYDLSQMAGTSNTVNVVALQQNSKAYQIYVPTSVKKNSSTNCSYTNSKRGSYPNYGGRQNVSVDNNTANYSCDYVSFANNKYWIKKSGTSVINNKSVPYTTKNYYEYYSNGDVKFKFVVNSSNNVLKYAYGYDQAGNIIKKYTYQSGTVYGKNHGNKIKTIYYLNHGKVTQARTYNENMQLIYIYEYYSGTTLNNTGEKIKYRFNINPNSGYIIDAFGYTEGSDRKRNKVYKYYSKTKFGSHGSRIQYRFEIKPGTSYITKAYRYRTGSAAGGYDKIYTYQANTNYGSQSQEKYNDVFWLKGSNNEIDYAIKYKNGNKYIKYTYDSGTIYGHDHGSHIKNRYYY